MKNHIIIFLLFLFPCCKVQERKVGQIEVQKIWDKAPHNAFTDLLMYKNNFYCTFREGPDHVSGPKGTARILKSADGENWRSIANFKMEGLDLRDPKLSITPDNKIMVLIDVETYKDGKVDTRKPYVSYADSNGEIFSEPIASYIDESIAVKSDWVWRVTWKKNVGYAIDYQPGGNLFLLKTTDGKRFTNVSKINIDGKPNESTIRFDKNGKMYVLVRREGGDKMGVIATADAPYANWEFNKMTERIGGPNFIFLNDSTLCIGSRQYIPNPPGSAKEYKKYITSIFITDLKGKINKTIPIEQSFGDTSYPGMVVYKNKLWMSYYSSHEEKTAIYLAKIPLVLLKP